MQREGERRGEAEKSILCHSKVETTGYLKKGYCLKDKNKHKSDPGEGAETGSRRGERNSQLAPTNTDKLRQQQKRNSWGRMFAHFICCTPRLESHMIPCALPEPGVNLLGVSPKTNKNFSAWSFEGLNHCTISLASPPVSVSLYLSFINTTTFLDTYMVHKFSWYTSHNILKRHIHCKCQPLKKSQPTLPRKKGYEN